MAITIEMNSREQTGRGSARRARREGFVPAIVYGTGKNIAVRCIEKELVAHLQNPTFHSTVLTLNIDGEPSQALVRDVQMHPWQRKILHADFQLVRADAEIAATVPIEFVGASDSPGVRLHHGIFTTIENQLQVHCLPKDLPEKIVVDVSGLEIGKSVHLLELTPPEGVRFDAVVRGEDLALATITEVQEEKEETPAEEGAAEATTEEGAATSSDS